MSKLISFMVTGCIGLLPLTMYSQYILNGNAKQESCNCYLLTRPETNQSGSVWQSSKITLEDPFDFAFNVNLGCLDGNGADGIVFMLQPISTSLGAAGGGMGFAGVSPSIGIVLDTWQNTDDNDPSYDHISIQANGVTKHGSDLAGPIAASSTSDNIEDCNWHVLRIKWDPSSQTLSAYFDGVFRLEAKDNLVANVFKNDPKVYWGFSSATGGNFNTQKFCTALNPVFNSGLTDDQICLGNPVVFRDSSTSFTTIKSYYWDFGDGSTSELPDPPAHDYAQPGVYQVKHYITAMDNCVSEPFIKTIRIGDAPKASFQAFDTCQQLNPRVDLSVDVQVGTIQQWNWDLNHAPFSTSENPDFSSLSPGNYTLKLTAVSDIGCVSNSYNDYFSILPHPDITMGVSDGCINVPLSFSAQQKDNITTISKWRWDFGDGSFTDQQQTSHVYLLKKDYPVQLSATATNGCVNTLSKELFINSVDASAGNDTLVIPHSFFQLNGTGGSLYTWSPATGLDNPGIPDPVGNVSDDINYTLTVKTREGCTDTATKKVTVFKGSAIYVPTAFTPDQNGVNDRLKPAYIGIKELSYFRVYNRMGQKVFSTSNLDRSWDGYFGGEQQAGSYVWVLKATDIEGKIYQLKGSFVLLK